MHVNQQGCREVINIRRHVIRLIPETEIIMFSWENRRSISMTNHLSNLLNQHTRTAQSKQSFSANCTGRECVFVSGREGKWKRKNKSDLGRMGQREIQLPICIATSLHGHQKQIRCRGKWPREIVSQNSREQSDDLSGGRAGAGRGAIELIQIYIVENSICPFSSSKCFRFTRHQSNLFVGTHQGVRPGLHTVIPIQFAPSVPRVLTVA